MPRTARVRGAPGSLNETTNLPSRDYIKESPPPRCARGVSGGRGWRGAGRAVVFPASRVPPPGCGPRGGTGTGPWTPGSARAAPWHKGVCMAREGRRWEEGRRWPSSFFFFSPVRFSHFLPGRGRGPAGDGEGGGGHEWRERPGPARGGLAGATRRLRGSGTQFPFPHSSGPGVLTAALAAVY